MYASVYVMHSLFCQTVMDDDGAYIRVDGSMCIDVHVCVLVRIRWRGSHSREPQACDCLVWSKHPEVLFGG